MDKIIIHEVGPRDGLQVEKTVVPLAEKISWIDGLCAAGIDIIQLGSFVNPEKVPQMADTDVLFQHFTRNKPAGVTLSGLALNEKGLERGLACGVEMFCLGVSASETHSQKNTGMNTAEALRRIVPMAKEAMAAGKIVQASVQSAFGCGYEVRSIERRCYTSSKHTWMPASATSAWPTRPDTPSRSRWRTYTAPSRSWIRRWNWPATFTIPMGWDWPTVTRR